MAYYTCKVKVMRNGPGQPLTEVDSNELVPGDVIEIPEQCVMPCDLVVIGGSAIVNESMLTGESIPVIKNSMLPTTDIFDASTDSKYIIYSGTKTIQTKNIGD